LLYKRFVGELKFAGKGTVPAQFGSNVPLIPASDTDYMIAALTYNFGWIAFAGILVLLYYFLFWAVLCC